MIPGIVPLSATQSKCSDDPWFFVHDFGQIANGRRPIDVCRTDGKRSVSVSVIHRFLLDRNTERYMIYTRSKIPNDSITPIIDKTTGSYD